jgi:hypothetical protein
MKKIALISSLLFVFVFTLLGHAYGQERGIIVPSGKLQALYSKVKGKKFSVRKLDGTIDDRQDDLQELAQDWIFYRNRILKYQHEADYEKAAKARRKFQQVNAWLDAYDPNDVSFMISVFE